MARERAEVLNATDNYFSQSGVVDEQFLKKFFSTREGFIGPFHDPYIILPLIVERLFLNGNYQMSNKDHKHSSFMEYRKIRHGYPLWGYSRRRIFHSWYSGMDLNMDLTSKDKQLSGNSKIKVSPTSEPYSAAHIWDLHLKKVNHDVAFHFVTDFGEIIKYHDVKFSDGRFIIERDGKKSLLEVDFRWDRTDHKFYVKDWETGKSLFEGVYEKESKTPQTDTVTQFIEKIYNLNMQ